MCFAEKCCLCQTLIVPYEYNTNDVYRLKQELFFLLVFGSLLVVVSQERGVSLSSVRPSDQTFGMLQCGVLCQPAPNKKRDDVNGSQ